MKPAEIRELSDAQLVEKLKEMRAELFNLRFQMATSQLDNTARVKVVKKDIARIVTERKRHAKYGKMMTSSKKLHAHDEECTAGVGDTVRVMETRPMSKMKRWRLIEVVERAK